MDEQKEWDESEEVNLPQETWARVWSSIERKRKLYGKMFWMKTAAVAASVTVLVIAGINLFRITEAPAPGIKVTRNNEWERKLIVNTAQKVITAYLPDSSVVLLSPAATLKYEMPDLENRRDCYLTGEARFIVRRDTSKPFTVYAGELATTALGTEFTINNSATERISIRLHSGKVVVKQAGTSVRSWKKDVYLKPGEQLSYNTLDMTASVTNINEFQVPSKSAGQRKRQKILASQPVGELAFVNSPLAEVIGRLEKHFEASIKYDSADLAQANFTGTFGSTDSLGIILRIIGQMNNLEVQKSMKGYELRRAEAP